MTKPNGWTGETWSVVEHSWSDTSVVGPEGTIVTLSIYDKATEETQAELESLMAKRARLIAASPSLYEALAKSIMYIEGFTQIYPLSKEAKDAFELARAALSAAEGGV